MISLDQVLLLKKKVEAAVEKIVSLEAKLKDSEKKLEESNECLKNAENTKDENLEKIQILETKNQELKKENDALRSRCAELTNALSNKTELVSNLEVVQGKIEAEILNALNKLDIVENSVLSKQTDQKNVTQETVSQQKDSLVETDFQDKSESFAENENFPPVQQNADEQATEANINSLEKSEDSLSEDKDLLDFALSSEKSDLENSNAKEQTSPESDENPLEKPNFVESSENLEPEIDFGSDDATEDSKNLEIF